MEGEASQSKTSHTATDSHHGEQEADNCEESLPEQFTEVNDELLINAVEVPSDNADILDYSRVEDIDLSRTVEDIEDSLVEDIDVPLLSEDIGDSRVEDIEVPLLSEPEDRPDGPVPPVAPVKSWCRCLLVVSLASVWVSSVLYCYLYFTTTCTTVQLWCPSPSSSFTARACCSSLWLSLGAPVGLGNECTIQMSDMEAGCPMYDCYKNKTDGSLNVNGCSYVPNTLFNVGACNIHDLCYITPGATKKECDDTFVDNILRIYCHNVNVLEQLACTGRAQVAGAVVSAINTFYDDSEEIRAGCSQTVSHCRTAALLLTVVVAVIIPIIFITRSQTTSQHLEQLGTDDVILEEKIEEITATEGHPTITTPDPETEDVKKIEVNVDVVTKPLCEDEDNCEEISNDVVDLTEDLTDLTNVSQLIAAKGQDPSSTMESTEHTEHKE